MRWAGHAAYEDLLGCCAVLAMEAISTSETSVNFYQTTRRNIPEDSHLHERTIINISGNWVEIRTGELPIIQPYHYTNLCGEIYF
jgi:hypothetical protein